MNPPSLLSLWRCYLKDKQVHFSFFKNPVPLQPHTKTKTNCPQTLTVLWERSGWAAAWWARPCSSVCWWWCWWGVSCTWPSGWRKNIRATGTRWRETVWHRANTPMWLDTWQVIKLPWNIFLITCSWTISTEFTEFTLDPVGELFTLILLSSFALCSLVKMHKRTY